METFPTLAAMLRYRSGIDPDLVAYADEKSLLTWRELMDQASVVAAGLAATGVEPGDRVVLLLPAGLDFIRVFWGIHLLGGVPIAQNPYPPAETMMRRAKRVRPALVVIQPDQQQVDEAARAALRTAGIPALTIGGSAQRVMKDDAAGLAYIQSTSGTSGEPRAAMVSHRNVDAYLQALGAGFAGTEPRDVNVAWVPPWHDLGLVRFVIATAYFGSTCHIVQPAIHTIPLWLKKVGEVGATLTGAPDFAYRLAARMVKRGEVDLSTLRYASNGGEPARRSTVENFEAHFGIQNVVAPGYGLAEATLGVSSVRPGGRLHSDDHGNVSCGTPLEGVEVRVDDSGEVLVRGATVFLGYFDAEEATRDVLRDGWLHTGDSGRLDEQGQLYILGRMRAILKRGGAAIAPRELEEAAHTVEGVKLAAAVGLPRADETEQIAIVIETDTRSEELDQLATTIDQAIRDALGFSPEKIIAVAARAIPRTYNGKIRHAVLRAGLSDGSFARKGLIRFTT